MRLALPTISSKSATSRVRTACAPHSSPSPRAVAARGVSTMSGTDGRSREIRRAVEPESVKHMIAAADTVSAMRLAANESASAVVASGSVSVKWMRAW